MEEKIKINREYLGVIITADNYSEIRHKDGKDKGKFVLDFHKKHLRAYIKGKTRFQHGWEFTKDGDKKPVFHDVQEKIS